MEYTVSPESLLALLGVIVSLVFSYFPGLRVLFAAQSSEWKSGIMIGMLAVLTAILFGMGCAGSIHTGLACDQTGVWRAVSAFIAALVANQGTWQATKNLKPYDVKFLSGQSGATYNPEALPTELGK